jgi:hypothetical protein
MGTFTNQIRNLKQHLTVIAVLHLVEVELILIVDKMEVKQYKMSSS